ncbi:MAG: Stp1/IreP family PP2C-type Ser/Thr phosphatase [Eubacterium sp.]
MKAYGATNVGLTRSVNQDYIYASVEAVGNLPNLFIVADGMGGHKAGEVASRYTVDNFVNFVSTCESKDPIYILDEGIHFANRQLIELAKGNPDYQGMGTTFVVATIIAGTIYIANVGDSRLYLLNGDIKQITRDHSLVEEMVSMGELDKSQARTHYKKNIITRAMGAESTVIADLFEIEVNDGDMVLMCSDGLSNMIDDYDLRKIAMSSKELPEAVHRLIDEANKNGGKDNISVVLIEPDYNEVETC